MSQHNDEHSYLTGRIIGLLAERYGFREHWEVSLSNNISQGTVSVLVTLLQTPGRRRSGDIQSRFDIDGWLFPEFSVVSDRVLVASRQVIDRLRYRNQQASHPPQVKIYRWLEENSLEMRDQYMVTEYTITPFPRDANGQALLARLLGLYLDEPVSVEGNRVRIGSGRGEMVFRTSPALLSYIEEVDRVRSQPALPTPQVTTSHVRRVEL